MWPLTLATSLQTTPPPPSSVDPPSAVVGGHPAEEDRWPGVVALYGVAETFACTGVLVAPDLVLTAGHCGFGIASVEFGSTRLGEGQQVEVIENIVHPDYFTTLDAAILVLEQPITAPVAALVRDCEADNKLVDGALATIVGFGAIDEWASEWTEQLNEADTEITDAVCENTAVGCNEEVSPGGELIAGGNGIDSCTGDSGGPLYVPGDDGVPLLAAITSRATIPAPTPCGNGGIYVRADVLAEWIESERGIALPRPDCEGINRTPTATAAPLTVTLGQTAATLITVDDPDADQTHTFSFLTPPERGFAQLDPDGALYYLAPDDGLGSDLAVVSVTDNGMPPRSATVEIPITIYPPKTSLILDRRGCATVETPGVFASLVALFIRRRTP